MFKMTDGSIFIRRGFLDESSTIDEINQVHLAMGHELGHLVLGHEFITNTYQRVSSVLIENNEIAEKKLDENLEADIFSLALFCLYVKETRFHHPPFRYSIRYFLKLLPNSRMHKKQIEQIINFLKIKQRS